jgi:protoporphyrinogen oxidase
MRNWNVGIVGGGPGGLMTAYALQKLADKPIRVTLFEASERLCSIRGWCCRVL